MRGSPATSASSATAVRASRSRAAGAVSVPGAARSGAGLRGRRARAREGAQAQADAGGCEDGASVTATGAHVARSNTIAARECLRILWGKGAPLSKRREALFHLFADARAEEDARRTFEGLLEGPVALRVAAEAGIDRGRKEALLATRDGLDEANQAQARSVGDQGQADVPVEGAAHLAGVTADQPRQVGALQVGPALQRVERPRRQRVTIGGADPQPVGLAPDVAHLTLDRSLVIVPGPGGTGRAQAAQGLDIEAKLRRAAGGVAGVAGEHALGERRGHADHVQVQIRRRVEEDVILAGRPPEEVARRGRDRRLAGTERGPAGRDEVQLGLGMEMARPSGGRDVMPDVTSRGAWNREGLVKGVRHDEKLAERSPARPARRDRPMISHKMRSHGLLPRFRRLAIRRANAGNSRLDAKG